MNQVPEARPLPRTSPKNLNPTSTTSGKKLPKLRLFALVPFLRDAPAAYRLMRAEDARLWSKALIVVSVLYVVWPLDLVPDAVPVLSWFDDVGVVLLFRLLLTRELDRYREPTVEKAPVGPKHDGYRSEAGLPVA